MKGDKTIRLREAAILSGYHPDYLSYLIRNRKLLGIRRGHNWFVYENELKAYVAKRKEEAIVHAPILKKIDYKAVFWPWIAFAVLALFLLLANFIYSGLNMRSAEAQDSDGSGNTKLIQTYYNDQGGKAVSAAAK